MAGDSTRVNGTTHGWDSLKLKIDSEPITGATAIDYGDAVEKAYAWGMGKHHAPRARTRGKYTPKMFAITVPTATAEVIRQNLKRKAGRKGISNVEVPIVLQIIEADDGPTITIEALEACLVENEGSHEESPDPTQEKLNFMPMRLLRNGVALHDTSEAGS